MGVGMPMVSSISRPVPTSRGRGSAIIGVLVVVSVVLLAQAALAEPPGIGFSDETALEPDADALIEGVEVSICNSAAQSQAVHVYLEQFAFTDATTGDALESDAVIVVDPVEAPIEPGLCEEFFLRWADPAAPPELREVSYAGSLFAVSSGGGSARLEVSIPGASPVGKAMGVLEPLDLQGSFGILESSGPVDLQSQTLLFRYDGDVAPTIPEDKLLAVVGYRSDLAKITTTGESSVVDERAKVIGVSVEVTGAGGNGKFVGKVSPSLVGDVDEPVAISVTVRDGIGLLLLWTGLGLLVGFLVKVVSGRLMPWFRIRTFRRAIDGEYVTALKAFQGASPTFEDRFELASSNEWKDRIGEATRRYKGSTLLFDKTNPALKAILDDLAAARSDAALLGNRGDGGLYKSLGALQSALKDLVTARRRVFPDAPRAVVEVQAHRALGGGREKVVIPVGGAGKVRQQADAATALLETWVRWAGDHDRYRRWSVILREQIGDPGADEQRKSDVATLNGLDDRLREVLFEMLDGADEEEFTAMGIESEVRHVYAGLASLAGHYGVYLAEDPQAQAPPYPDAVYMNRGLARYSQGAAFEPEGFDLEQTDALSLPEELSGQVLPFGISPAVVRQMAEVAAGAGAVVLEVVIAIAALALAAAAALMPLYVDRPFGTPSDYLKVFIAGATAQLLVSGLFNVVRAWRDPIAAAET